MKIEKLSVKYGDKVVFNDFTLEIEKGKILAILGDSGSGKTTLLNAVSGVIKSDAVKADIPKKVSYVFQDDRLIPTLTVLENVKYIGVSGEEAEKALEKVEMTEHKDKYPSKLSGGERQRVALARAYAYGAKLWLLDEPFSSLDLALKIRIINTFASLFKNGDNTAILVSHDIDEALAVADRVVYLKNGKIVFDEKVEREEFPSEYGKNSELKEKLLGIIKLS